MAEQERDGAREADHRGAAAARRRHDREHRQESEQRAEQEPSPGASLLGLQARERPLERHIAERRGAEHRERYGRLDMLVNSAGIGIGGNVETLPAKHFALQMGINVRGLFLVTQAAIPLLRESKGWLVNPASIPRTLPTPGPATYVASKAAVHTLHSPHNHDLDTAVLRARAIFTCFVPSTLGHSPCLGFMGLLTPEHCWEAAR